MEAEDVAPGHEGACELGLPGVWSEGQQAIRYPLPKM